MQATRSPQPPLGPLIKTTNEAGKGCLSQHHQRCLCTSRRKPKVCPVMGAPAPHPLPALFTDPVCGLCGDGKADFYTAAGQHYCFEKQDQVSDAAILGSPTTLQPLSPVAPTHRPGTGGHCPFSSAGTLKPSSRAAVWEATAPSCPQRSHPEAPN